MSNQNKKNKIGVFDSGLGGLNILKDFLKTVPGYHYIYLGDTARVPYGDKSAKIIYEYCTQALDFLFSQGCSLVIFACNSASAQALRQIQEEYLSKKYKNKKVLGVIRPLAEEFANKNLKRIGIIGTKATIHSHAYEAEINKLSPEKNIYSQSTPLLVPLIEAGWSKKPETKMILKKYLRPLKEKNVEALILACTHYPFLKKEIQKIMGKRVQVPCPGEIIATKLLTYLKNHPELSLAKSKVSKVAFYTTDDSNSFKELGEKFLNAKIESINKINLD